jgi:hypothetical protein
MQIDREAIVSHLRRAQHTTAVGIVPPMSGVRTECLRISHDPAQAERFLEWLVSRPDGPVRFPLSTLAETSTTRSQIRPAIQHISRVGIVIDAIVGVCDAFS